eukprot:scaffold2578_cov370-Prasinococcus_capsulatus_cf.AAC.1
MPRVASSLPAPPAGRAVPTRTVRGATAAARESLFFAPCVSPPSSPGPCRRRPLWGWHNAAARRRGCEPRPPPLSLPPDRRSPSAARGRASRGRAAPAWAAVPAPGAASLRSSASRRSRPHPHPHPRGGSPGLRTYAGRSRFARSLPSLRAAVEESCRTKGPDEYRSGGAIEATALLGPACTAQRLASQRALRCGAARRAAARASRRGAEARRPRGRPREPPSLAKLGRPQCRARWPHAPAHVLLAPAAGILPDTSGPGQCPRCASVTAPVHAPGRHVPGAARPMSPPTRRGAPGAPRRAAP